VHPDKDRGRASSGRTGFGVILMFENSWIKKIIRACRSSRAATVDVAHREVKRQLLIDVSTLIQVDLRTGIQRVVRSLLFELIQHPPEGFVVEPIYADLSKVGFFYARNYAASLMGTPAVLDDSLVQVNSGDIFLGLDWSPFVIDKQKKVLKKLKAAGVSIYFVVYDLLPILMPERCLKKTTEFYEKWLKIVLGYEGVICISQTVSLELKQWIQINKIKTPNHFLIEWFHLGADLENSVPSWGIPAKGKQLINRLNTQQNFLAVNTLEARKGYDQLLSAFEVLWKQGNEINLIMVGKQGWMVETLIDKIRHHPELGKRLFWLEGISDEYLAEIYSIATCLVAASEGEGFGLALIEAAKHKIPIIARDLPVFREVAGDNAYYFNGLAAEDLATCIKSWINLFHENSHPDSKQLSWLTWKQSAEQLKMALITQKET
jgi:glycosyltransferase involved in cell wall biosynthesis